MQYHVVFLFFLTTVVQFELLNATEVQVEEGRSISLCLAPVGNVSAYYDRLLPYITVIFNVTSETAGQWCSRVHVS